MVMPLVLKTSELTKSFYGVKALSDVSLEVAPGEVHCLAGENGSGKSTFIKLISGEHVPDHGSIELNGHQYSHLTPAEAIRQGVGVIYQDLSIFPNLTVMENLALNEELGSKRKIVNWRRIRRIATEALGLVGADIDLDRMAGELPIADRQLIAIARSLMMGNPRLLIMDEPTTALTKREVDRLFSVVKSLTAKGIAVLFVSHKLDEVFDISDRFTVLRNGEKVVTKRADELNQEEFSYYMTGRKYDPNDLVRADAELGDIFLEAKSLSVAGAFNDVNLQVRQGEIVGVTGLLGSGRTELALSLFGALKPTSGSVKIGGTDLALKNIPSAINQGVAYVPEDRLTEGLMLDQSISDNIAAANLDQLTSTGGFLSRKTLQQNAANWISEFNIAAGNPENAASSLSGGNQQRVVLAKWLATKPQVLLLNGPTVGVDIGSKFEINQMLLDLAKRNMTIVVFSDDIPELVRTCSRVLIMKDGRITDEMTTSETTEDELSKAVVAGKA